MRFKCFHAALLRFNWLDAALLRFNWLDAALLPLALAACAHAPAQGDGPPPVDTSILVDPATIAGDFLARQRIHGTMGGRSLGAEVVLQKRGGTLTLLGLTPFGTRAFALIQEGGELRTEVATPDALPFPPELMLVDVHRALLVGDGPQADGRHRWRLQGERVVDTWRGGRLIVREIRRRRAPRGRIIVDYGEGMAGDAPPVPPPTITIDNQILGYRVTIETVAYQRLD